MVSAQSLFPGDLRPAAAPVVDADRLRRGYGGFAGALRAKAEAST